MSIERINELNVNHIGIVIPVDMKEKIEGISQETFIEDKIQGVSVCFVWDEDMKIYREYITQEGRAKDYSLGYNHICYDVESSEKMNQLHKHILKSKLGLSLIHI